MARGVRAKVGEEIFAAVVNAATQVEGLLQTADMMGGGTSVAMRVRQLIEAQRSGDERAIRAAYVDLSVTSAASAAAIDYGTPSR